MSLPATLVALCRAVTPPQQGDYAAAAARQAQLTKPPGSLGALETLGNRLAAMQQRVAPDVSRAAIAIFAADHGVAEEGVSAYPQEVTLGMVHNFLAGGAAINQLAAVSGAELLIVDVGVKGELAAHPGLERAKVAWGTANFSLAPAMTAAACVQAVQTGAAAAQRLTRAGAQLLVGGEIGIANTTSAAALSAWLCRVPPAEVTGRGTGLDAQGLEHKRRVVEKALALHAPDIKTPFDALACLGGLESAALVGFYLQAAATRTPILLDGFIATAAALVAAELAPAAKGYMIASHLSQEQGHRMQLAHLQLEPLFALDLRLGEGSGAALAIPMVQSAAALLANMATFEEAGLS